MIDKVIIKTVNEPVTVEKTATRVVEKIVNEPINVNIGTLTRTIEIVKEGAQGPTGPEGPTGPTGPTGDLVIDIALFTITIAGTNTFAISAAADELIAVTINGIDYAQFCSISPAGSGNVAYDDTDKYKTEVDDIVRISFIEE